MNGPPVPWVTWKTICCPSTGLDGLPMVRFPPRVTRKSLPRPAFTAIVAASVRKTTVGATAPCSTVVAGAADAGEAKASPSAVPPAAPTAVTMTALLKIFLRLSAFSGPSASVLPGSDLSGSDLSGSDPSRSEPASLELDARRRVQDCLFIVPLSSAQNRESSRAAAVSGVALTSQSQMPSMCFSR